MANRFQDDTLRYLLGFTPNVLHDMYKILHNLVDILSFDIFFSEIGAAQGMIFKRWPTGTIHNFSMNADPDFEHL